MNRHYPVFFLFQIIFMVGSAFSLQHIGPLMMSLLPCMAGHYYFSIQKKTPGSSRRVKSLQLFFIGALAFFIFKSFGGEFNLTSKDILYLSSFAFWGLGVVYFGADYFRRDQKKFFTSLM